MHARARSGSALWPTIVDILVPALLSAGLVACCAVQFHPFHIRQTIQCVARFCTIRFALRWRARHTGDCPDRISVVGMTSSSDTTRQSESASVTTPSTTRPPQLQSHNSVPASNSKPVDSSVQPIGAVRASVQAKGSTLHRVESTGAFRPDETVVSRSPSNLYNLQVYPNKMVNTLCTAAEGTA